MKQLNSEIKNMTPSRRSIVTAGLWSAPAILATSAIPAYAASPTELVGVTPHAWQKTFSKRKHYAADSTSYAGGFISTIPGNDFNEQFTRNTDPNGALNTSNDPDNPLTLGFWLESDNGLPVPGKILSIDITHTLGPSSTAAERYYKPEQSYFTEGLSPNMEILNAKGDVFGNYDWSSPSIVSAPWVISGYGTQQVVLNWTNPGIETEVSTSNPYTGYRVPGYFLNFNLTNNNRVVSKITTTRKIVWEDVNGQHTKEWTVSSNV